MKNVIIWGVPRSGKSTLAARIASEFKLNLLSVDALRESYKTLILPEIMPKDNYNRSKIITPAILKLLEILEYTTKQFGHYFVLEGVTIDMEYLTTHLDMEKYIIICMAYPNMLANDKFNEMIKYDTENDWTNKLSLEKKQELCNQYVLDSKKIKETAERLGLKFIDSSNREKALKEAFNYIKENLNK